MQFFIEQSILSLHLSIVAKNLPSRPVHDILGNILCVANTEKRNVTLTTFDLETSVSTEISDVNVVVSGETTIQGKLFTDLVSKVSGYLEIVLEEIEDCKKVSLKTSDTTVSLGVIDASEFPTLPEVSEEQSFAFNTKDFFTVVAPCVKTAATDETKAVLKGVSLKADNGDFEAAGTDGHRLCKTIAILPEPYTFITVIPADLLKKVETICKAVKSNFVLSLAQDFVMFQIGHICLKGRLLQGSYPPYNKLIPEEFESIVEVEKEDFLKALDVINLLKSQRNNGIKLEVKESKVVLSPVSPENGNGESRFYGYIHKGKGEKIGFNCNYLIDAIKNIPSDELVIKYNTPDRPVIFTQNDSPWLEYLLMPIQLRD